MENLRDNITDAQSQITSELIKVLGNVDPKYCDIITGIERVLADTSNPDRFAQAANSIRGLTDRLVRGVKSDVAVDFSALGSAKQSEVLVGFDKFFEKALKYMPKLSKKNDQKSQINGIKEQYDDLKKALISGKMTLRLKIKRHFGKDDEIQRLPKQLIEEIEKIIRLWADTNKYFIKIAHYDDKSIDDRKFMDNWYVIQRCILKVLTPFAQQIPALNKVLQYSEPPNE